MTDDAEELFHAAVRFTQSKRVRLRLSTFPQELRPCIDQCCQPRNGVCQGDLMRGIGMLSTAVIYTHHANQAFFDTDGGHQNHPYIIGKDSGVKRQGHPLKDENLVVFEM